MEMAPPEAPPPCSSTVPDPTAMPPVALFCSSWDAVLVKLAPAPPSTVIAPPTARPAVAKNDDPPAVAVASPPMALLDANRAPASVKGAPVIYTPPPLASKPLSDVLPCTPPACATLLPKVTLLSV